MAKIIRNGTTLYDSDRNKYLLSAFLMCGISIILLSISSLITVAQLNSVGEDIDIIKTKQNANNEHNHYEQEQLKFQIATLTDAIADLEAKNASLTDAVEEMKLEMEVKEVNLLNGEVKESEEESEEEVETSVGSSLNTNGTFVGSYQLTAYIATGNPCADGVYPQVGYTVACNDSSLWHKWIYIEGYGKYYVHDTGGMSSNVIDVFVGSYDEAIQFGRRSANVYIVE